MKPYYYLVQLKKYEDNRGTLIPFELNNNCSFDIKRVFYVYGVPSVDISRGEHINSDARFLFVAVSGSVTIDVQNKEQKETFILDSPDKALFIDKNIYKRMYNFSKDAVLLCMSDNYYNPSSYI